MCHGQKSRFAGDGHPTLNRNPYNRYYKTLLLGWWPSPIIYGNNGSLDPGTDDVWRITCIGGFFVCPYIHQEGIRVNNQLWDLGIFSGWISHRISPTWIFPQIERKDSQMSEPPNPTLHHKLHHFRKENHTLNDTFQVIQAVPFSSPSWKSLI